jgi:hypothetical protein
MIYVGFVTKQAGTLFGIFEPGSGAVILPTRLDLMVVSFSVD